MQTSHPSMISLISMIIIAKQVMSAPPAPEPPQPRRRYSCAVMSARPAGYLPPSDSESEEDDSNSQYEEEEAEDSQQSVPEYEEDVFSTHSTPHDWHQTTYHVVSCILATGPLRDPHP
jgi:hypothetical protein